MPGAIATAEALSAEYTDLHCSVFTFDSFRALMADLDKTGLVPWRIIRLADVQPGENVFRVLLEAA